MVIGIFRSRLRPEARPAYGPVAERMDALARSIPGYLWHKTFRAEDGERVTLFAFESLTQLEAWRDQPEHREAQRRGRAEFYAEYSLHVCTPIRESNYPIVVESEEAGFDSAQARGCTRRA